MSHPGILEFPILPNLSVHCFSRDGREAGPGPLFILREWDLKVIRTIGHKPKCKGPNQEQALRACVRQGLLSMQLKTENATKEEIQVLKQVGVLGKRAPSGSLIGGADLLRLLEYFSKRDVADAFKLAMKKKRDEGVVSEEVWKEIAAVKEKDVLHKFKINTEDHHEEEEGEREEERSKGGEKRKKKVKSAPQTKRSASKKAKKRKSETDEGGGRKRRRGSVSSSSMASSSSSASLSSSDSHDEEKKRGREHRNGHKKRGSASQEERREREGGGRDGDRPPEEYQSLPQHELLQAGVFNDVRVAYPGGQRRQAGGGHTVQLLQQGPPQMKREMNGIHVGAATPHRGQFPYSASSTPPYSIQSSNIPQTSSPTNGYNGLYTTGRLPSYNSLTSLASYPSSSSLSHHHLSSSMQQQPAILQTSYSPSPSHGSPLLASVTSPVTAHSVLQGGGGPAQKPDGLEVLMQASLHGKESVHDGQSSGGNQPQPMQQQRESSPHQHHSQLPQSLSPPHSQSQSPHLLDYRQQPQASFEMSLDSQHAQHVQSQHHQLYAQQTHPLQSQPSQQPPASFARQERPQVLMQSYLKSKDSPPYLAANSSFTYVNQPPSSSSSFHIKREYANTNTAASLQHIVTPPSTMSVSLPANVASSSVLSPLIAMGSSTPTSTGLHRPQARLSPANSFTNLASLVAGTAGSTLTRNISSSSLTLGLPNVSSVTSLSSLGGTGGSLSYNTLHTSMSMTSLNAADRSDDDDDLGGDAGIANGIIGFDDLVEGADVGDVRPFSHSSATSFYHYDPSSSSPLPRIPSIASLTEAGGGGVIPRIESNLSTLTSQFLPSPPSSRPSSPRGRGMGEGDRGSVGGRQEQTPTQQGGGVGLTSGATSTQTPAIARGPQHTEGTAVTAEG